MLLKKIYMVCYVDDSQSISTVNFSKKLEAEKELERLKNEGYDAWLEGKTVPIQ